MSDQEKIWFVYQTDHHEGPFSVSEVAEKVGQGLVNGQTLAWKDGMAEWIAAETIPELNGAFASGGAGAPGAGGEVSLAELLASQQGAAPAARESSIFESPGSALSSMVVSANEASASSVDASEPAGQEEVWSMKIGSAVSGLYSLDRLKSLAGEGEIPAEARFWRKGWMDFQALSAVPSVAAARRIKPAGAARGSAGPVGAAAARPRGFAPITAAADLGSDDPTDPSIKIGGDSKFGFLKKLFQRKPKAAPTLKTGAVMIGKKSSGGGGAAAAAKKILLLVILLAAVGGGGASYFLFFASPIPSTLDVLPDDRENLALLVKEPIAQGPKFAMAQARGTEDNPADETSPKFYVGSNMPEGTKLTLAITGKPGSLVNKINFEKSFTASLAKTHLATFELQDDGKPLPMGEYAMKITAEGADPYEVTKFLGGKKGAVYERRLKQYREKLDKEYADEVEELREFVSTLKNIQLPLDKHLEAFKTTQRNPADRTREISEWRAFVATFDGMSTQLEAKLKARLDAPDQRYYPRAYQDISSTLGQLRQLARANGERLGGANPTVNFDELQGLVQAGVMSLDQVVAQAVVKTAFDVQKSGAAVTAPAGARTAPPASAPAPSAAPQR